MKKYKLEIIFGAILLLAVIALFACKDKDEDEGLAPPIPGIQSEGLYVPEPDTSGLENAEPGDGWISVATNVVTATFTGQRAVSGAYVDLVFDLSENLKGKVDAKQFWLRMLGTDDWFKNASSYETGQEYVIVMEKRMSVYEDHDFFLPLKCESFPIEEYDSNDKPLNVKKKFVDGYKEKIAQIEDESSKTDIGYDYIRSEDWSDIVKGSDYIAIIEPNKSTFVGLNGRSESFECSVIQTLKGEIFEEQIYLVLIKGQAKPGERYLVLLDRPEAGADYILSSKKSTVPLSDKETVNAIKSLIN